MLKSNIKVIAALIVKDNKILIAQRNKIDHNYGKWEFPGGKLELKETEQDCLKRELFEELGIDAIIGDYFGSSYFEYNDITIEFKVYYVSSFINELTLYEHNQIKWVSTEELLHYDFPDPDKPIIEKLLNK